MAAPAPWVNPLIPNLTDYLAFVVGELSNPSVNLPYAAGAATSVTASSLTDTAQTWVAGQWVNCWLYDSTANVTVPITGNTTNTVTFATQTAPLNVADAYVIMQPIVYTSFTVAMAIVNDALAQATPATYVLAVYNLAMDRLVRFAPDQQNQTYFSGLRTQFNLVSTSVGAVASASDQGTSASIANPEWMRQMTMRDIQTLRTPWGREYMGFAQAWGPFVWGLS